MAWPLTMKILKNYEHSCCLDSSGKKEIHIDFLGPGLRSISPQQRSNKKIKSFGDVWKMNPRHEKLY